MKNIIRRILQEETKIPISIRRRFNGDKVLGFMKTNAIKKLSSSPGLRSSIIDVAALETAKEVLPWYDENGEDYAEDDYQMWLKSVVEYLIQKYGKEIKEYVDKVLPQSAYNRDGANYVFIKHSERGGGGAGFSEGGNFTWADLMGKRGWWFPINWWEVKEKLDIKDSGMVTFLKPGDEHNKFGYYFSIKKNKID